LKTVTSESWLTRSALVGLDSANGRAFERRAHARATDSAYRAAEYLAIAKNVLT
jgi:hypothetical protein